MQVHYKLYNITGNLQQSIFIYVEYRIVHWAHLFFIIIISYKLCEVNISNGWLLAYMSNWFLHEVKKKAIKKIELDTFSWILYLAKPTIFSSQETPPSLCTIPRICWTYIIICVYNMTAGRYEVFPQQ